MGQAEKVGCVDREELEESKDKIQKVDYLFKIPFLVK